MLDVWPTTKTYCPSHTHVSMELRQYQGLHGSTRPSVVPWPYCVKQTCLIELLPCKHLRIVTTNCFTEPGNPIPVLSNSRVAPR